ncbi:Uncharacterised protein [Mycobacteroides abscessus subsp. massiliense]|nr:Uncharacterised protein [Mycobacteroides abscessus subsp. massiliense]
MRRDRTRHDGQQSGALDDGQRSASVALRHLVYQCGRGGDDFRAGRADDDGRRGVGVPVQGRRARQHVRSGVAAYHRVDHGRLQSRIPGAAGLGGLGIGAGGTKGQVTAVAQDALGERHQLLVIAGE